MKEKDESSYRYKHWIETYRAQSISRIFPPRIKKDLESFSIELDSEAVQYLLEPKSGNGLYLSGQCGSGKTLMAAAICMEVLEAEYLVRRMEPTDVKYANVPKLLRQIQDTYDSKNGITSAEIFNPYSEAKFLILDDIGVERGTEWTALVLYNLINDRYENLLPTIFTSNLDLTELAERLGSDRISSRIVQTCKQICLSGEDRRIPTNSK